MRVILKKDDPRFNMKKGDILEVEEADYDDEKYVVIKRISDGYDPECAVYKYMVDKLK